MAYALASLAHTQTILAALGELGVQVAPGERLATSLGDLAGLWPYALVIAVGLALGLLAVRAPPRRLVPLPPTARDALAGALAVASALLAMRLAFSITPDRERARRHRLRPAVPGRRGRGSGFRPLSRAVARRPPRPGRRRGPLRGAAALRADPEPPPLRGAARRYSLARCADCAAGAPASVDEAAAPVR